MISATDTDQPVQLVDALPYIDHGYDEPGVKEAVFALIEEETKRYKPTKNYLEHLPPPDLTQFETPLMKKEIERLAAGQRMPMLSMKRYDVPAPRSNVDVMEWKEAVDNSMAQLENLQIRITNLNLMNAYGSEAWKVYNTILTSLHDKTQRQVNELKKEIQEINWQRKSAQTTAGDKLKALETGWAGLVSKNFEIERACLYLEWEVAQLEQEVQKRRDSRLEQEQITGTNGPESQEE